MIFNRYVRESKCRERQPTFISAILSVVLINLERSTPSTARLKLNTNRVLNVLIAAKRHFLQKYHDKHDRDDIAKTPRIIIE